MLRIRHIPHTYVALNYTKAPVLRCDMADCASRECNPEYKDKVDTDGGNGFRTCSKATLLRPTRAHGGDLGTASGLL